MIILTEQLEWVQTLSSASFGYPNVRTNCVHCAALGGKVTTILSTSRNFLSIYRLLQAGVITWPSFNQLPPLILLER